MSFVKIVKTILKEEGFFGMWKGLEPNCLRACLVNIGILNHYYIIKE